MLIKGEKIIFSIESGFSLNGLEEFNIDDKYLQFTNLGNIIISKVDCLDEEYLKYSYSDYNIALSSKINENNIDIVAIEIPFEHYRNGFVRNISLNLLIVLDFDEFMAIESSIKDFIFEFANEEMFMIVDSKKIFNGKVINEDESIVFVENDSNETNSLYKINLLDIEHFTESYNRIKLQGVFPGEVDIARKIVFVGDISSYKLPIGFELRVESNGKIGYINIGDQIGLGSITGSINSDTYKDFEVIIIRGVEDVKIYKRYSKNLLLQSNIKDMSVYDIGNDEYILYDKKNIYKLRCMMFSKDVLSIDKLPIINDKKIGYTQMKNPFFMEIDPKFIRIYTTSNNNILEIKKEDISDIKITEELSLEKGDLVNVEIRFSNRLVVLNLKKELITELTENVFSDYQLSLFNKADVKEIYENWVKSVSDIVIYNLFGDLYSNSLAIMRIDFEKFDDIKWIEFINFYYNSLDRLVERFDTISLSLVKILEKNEMNYFNSIDYEIDTSSFCKLVNIIDSTRNNLNNDIVNCKNEFYFASNVLSEKKHRSKLINNLTDIESDQAVSVGKKFVHKFKHVLNNIMPMYIERVIVGVFEVYNDMYLSYEYIDESSLKIELMNRIKSIHVFKQFSDNNFENIYGIENNEISSLRKHIIEDMYALIKFSDMKIDSEYYYTGLYR